MAILVRFLALALLATLTSALEQWGLFGCPDFKKQADGIPYGNFDAMFTFSSSLLHRFPLKVIATGESEGAAQYSCLSFEDDNDDTRVFYYKNGTKNSTAFSYNFDFQFTGTFPKELLGSTVNATRTMTFVSDKDGIVVMKTCRSAFLSHYTSTYVMVDKTVDASSLDMRCLIPAIDKAFSIRSKANGVC